MAPTNRRYFVPQSSPFSSAQLLIFPSINSVIHNHNYEDFFTIVTFRYSGDFALHNFLSSLQAEQKHVPATLCCDATI